MGNSDGSVNVKLTSTNSLGIFAMVETAMLALPIALYYRKSMALLLLIGGIINVVLGVWVSLLGAFSITWLTGLIIGFIGFGYLTKPYFSVSLDEVSIYNIYGFKIKSYPLTSLNSLIIENRKLYTTSGGSRQKIRIAGWLVNPEHWKQLEKIIEQSR
jgi:hypothetical protein